MAYDALDVCRRGLIKINNRLRGLGDDQVIDLAARLRKSVLVTLSARTIRQQEHIIDHNIACLEFALSELRLLDREQNDQKMQQRLDRLEKLIQDFGAKERSANHFIDSTNPNGNDSSLQDTPPLQKYVQFAMTVYSRCGSTVDRDGQSSRRVDTIAASDDSSEEGIDIDGAPSEIFGEKTELNHQPEDPNGQEKPFLDCLEWELDEFIIHADTDIRALNFSAAQGHLENAISHGTILEREGRKPTQACSVLRERLVKVYIKLEKYSEARRITVRLVEDARVDKDKLAEERPDQSLRRAKLLYLHAHVLYLLYSKNKSRQSGSPGSTLKLAEKCAKEESFPILYRLLQTSHIGEEHPQFSNCVGLIVQIYEAQKQTVQAQAWRNKYLMKSPTQSDPIYDDDDLMISPIDSQREREERERAMKQLHEPGQTKLINSIIFNLPEQFQILLDNGADVEERYPGYLPPIMHAAGCRHVTDCGCEAAVRKLKDRNADINATGKINGVEMTALHLAVKADNVGMVHLLCELGVDTDACAPNTPLASAIKENLAHVARKLLDFEADAKITDDDDWTLLHHAVSCNSIEALKILLERNSRDSLGIDVNGRSSQRWTALMNAAERAYECEKYAIAELLIKYKADVNAIDGRGRSALHLTVSGTRTVVRENFANLLLTYGADRSVLEKIPGVLARYPGLEAYAPERRASDITLRRENSKSTVDSKFSKSTKSRFSFGRPKGRPERKSLEA